VRVRDHYPVARIEAPAERIASLTQPPLNAQIVAALQALGYRYITVDLTGYRMGSMNDGLANTPR